MRLPTYRRHSLRDIAFVESQGKRTYLPGSYGSEESRRAYAEFLQGFKQERRQKTKVAVLTRPNRRHATVSDVVVAFLAHAQSYYSEGKSGTNEFECCRNTGERLIRFAGVYPAENFGPLRLKAFRDSLVTERVMKGKSERRLSRRYVNMHLNRVRRMFRWAASEELVPETVWLALKTVDGLRHGRTDAPELPARKPVRWDQVEPILSELSPALARMVELQWLSGVRPQSIIGAQAEQFDLTGRAWRPINKNEWRGQSLVIPLGPRAMQLVTEQLEESRGLPYLFCPLRTGGRANARYGLCYTINSYRQSLQRAQQRAGIDPIWTPHQLRHGRATQVRELFGLEAAQAVLGHASIDATQIYASRLFEVARRVSDETG